MPTLLQHPVLCKCVCNFILEHKKYNYSTEADTVQRQNSTTAEEVAKFQHLFPNPSWVMPGEHPVTKTLFQYSQG